MCVGGVIREKRICKLHTKSLINKLSYSLAQKLFALLLNSDWLVQTSSVQFFQPIASIYRRGNFLHQFIVHCPTPWDPWIVSKKGCLSWSEAEVSTDCINNVCLYA